MDSIDFPQPIRILLVGLSEGFSRSATRYIAGDMRMLMTGVAPGLAINTLLISFTQPDVVLIDRTTLTSEKETIIRQLRIAHPAMRLICVTTSDESYHDGTLLTCADALISADAFAGELENLIGNFFPERFVPVRGNS